MKTGKVVRTLSLLLAMLMLAGMIPAAFATEKTGNEIQEATGGEQPVAGSGEEETSESEDGSVIVYRAFDVSLQKDGQEVAAEGEFRVTVETGLDAGSLIPEDTECVGTGCRLYHVHEGKADIVEDAEMDDDGILTFTTPNFSTFLLEYKVNYKTITRDFITASGETYTITVTYEDNALIPDDADLYVAEITEDDEAYRSYYEQVMGVPADSTEHEFARFFDIEIRADGKKIQPDMPVSVSIALKDVPEKTDLKVIHFEENGPTEIEAKTAEAKHLGETEVSFSAVSFSVYAVIVDADHAEPDLSERTVKIGVNGFYLENQTNYANPWAIRKTSNIDQAAEYHFESTDTPGVYRVYTMIDGQRHYMHINHHTGNPHSDNDNSACVNLTDSEYTMNLHVVHNSDGTYGIYRNDGGTDYYLNLFDGAGGPGFAAYADADGAGNSKLTFVSNDQTALQEGQYFVLAKIDEYYYIVNNDGTLTSVEYNETTNQVKVENPMMWTYTGTNLYHDSDAVDYDGSMVASDFYYKYIDPSAGTGISVDNAANTQQEIAGYKDTDGDNIYETPYYRIENGSRQMQSHSALTYVNKHLKSNNGEYYIGVTEENGVLKLAGGKDSNQAVEILFASPTSVLPVDSRNNTVSHIDISIEGTSEIEAPLAYGKYYDENGNELFEVSTPYSITLRKEGIGVSTDDMKKATIEAYIKNADGHAIPIDNAFYITGYSANAATEYSTPQVRIEGSFKVANLEPGDQDWQHRLNNKIYYSVTGIKTVTFDMIDPENGQLYDADGNKLTITIDIAFSASFDYWDERNECPPVRWDYSNWQNGNIPGGSGMDFVLGGDAEQAESNIVAVEITKLVVEPDGNRIKPSTSTPVQNSFEVYQYQNTTEHPLDPNSVIGVGIDGNPHDTVSYSNYVNLHSKSIKVGTGGMGIVYDYDVTPGMYYIHENPDSVNENIMDADGGHWQYVETRIETESPWRDDPPHDGKMHVTDNYTKENGSYNSIPEVLGNYPDINGNTTWIDTGDDNKEKPIRNGFLEFFVYNIYEPKKYPVYIKKVDMNSAVLTGAEFDLYGPYEAARTTDNDNETTGRKQTKINTNAITTAADGTVKIGDLSDGIYYLYETKAPNGYLILTEPLEITVNSANEGSETSVVSVNPTMYDITYVTKDQDDHDLDEPYYEITIPNTPGIVLPETGGKGTTIFCLLGGGLILAAGLLLAQRKKYIS